MDALRKRQKALAHFESLLRTTHTREQEWQDLFSNNPFVLTDTLPLRLTAIYPQVQLESGRPDFAFFECLGKAPELGYYGVIELKRPQDLLLRVYSEKHIFPSSAMSQAREQVKHYLDEMARTRGIGNQYSLAIGTAGYAFIIIGRTQEILHKCQSELHKLQLRQLLPAGMQFITYDDLFVRFRHDVAEKSQLFILDIPTVQEPPHRTLEPTKFQLLFDEFDIADHAITKIMTNRGWFRILSGHHRLVYGIPRKLWQIGETLYESYEHELREKVGDASVDELFAAYRAAGAEPLQAYEIAGYFDTEYAYWPQGAKMTVRQRDGKIGILEMPDWRFQIYPGDKLYRDDGVLCFCSQVPEREHREEKREAQQKEQ